MLSSVWLLFWILTSIGTTCVALYTHQLTVCRSLPSTSPADAYQRCLKGWREENLGLPLLPPFVVNKGETKTGIGLVLLRIPPAGLKEGIVDCQSRILASKDETSPCLQVIEMHYKVLNPSWITWPVKEHEGCITFTETAASGCDLKWHVQWTPLAVLPPFSSLWNSALEKITSLIIEASADYVAVCDASRTK